MQSEQLIASLLEQTRQLIDEAEQLKTYDAQTLCRRPQHDAWSVLECLEHLNRYGDYYLPQISNTINGHSSRHEAAFKSGMLGKYFANSMLPKEKLNKMKTFKDKDPIYADLDKTVIDRFIAQQIQFTELLQRSAQVSLQKVRIKTSISSLLRLKLGDTFQFIMNHNLRHLQQVKRILAVEPAQR